MNPNSYSPNYMLNRKRHQRDRNNSNDYSNEHYQSETKKEVFDLIAASDHNKKSDIDKERNRQRHKEREMDTRRHDHDKLHFKNNYERNENSNRREGKSSNTHQDNEENSSLNYEEIRNSNKGYQVREDYERRNKSKRRNFDNGDRYTQRFEQSDDYHNERARDRGYPVLDEDVNTSMRYKNSKKEDYRPRKSEKHKSHKANEIAEEHSYRIRTSYSYDRNRARDEEHKYGRDEKSSSIDDKNESEKEKKFNFMIILPKNYFRIIEEDYDYIVSEIKKRTHDLNFFQYDYKISNFSEYILRIGASRLSSKVMAIRILSDIFFQAMKQTYHNMSYLKISILVPSRIEGKNINSIREMTDTRIDVFQSNINNKYRQIEFQGSPENISRAAEKIYKIVNKYYFFDNSNPTPRERRGDNSSSRDEDRRTRKYKTVEKEDDRNKIKRPRVRLGNRNDRKKIRSEEGRRKHRHRNVTREEGETNANIEKENGHSQIRIRKSSISESNLRIENKEMEMVYKFPQESLSSSVPEQISENSPQNLNLIKIEQSNLIEISSFTNFPISQDTKATIISKDTLINNNIHISSENIYACDFQKIESKLAEAEIFSEDQKFALNIVVTNQNLNLLKNMKGNIFIEIENKYHCSISKKVEKLSNNEVNILTFYGTPEQNSLAVYYLQQIMSGKKDLRENTKI